jgi:hypothetical protein
MQLHSANPQQAPGSPKNNTRKRREFQHAIIAWIICLFTGSSTTLNFLSDGVTRESTRRELTDPNNL